MNRMWKQSLLAAAGLLLLTGSLQAEDAYVVVKGKKVVVERIQAKPDGTLVVYRKGAPTELKPGQYSMAVSPRPAELDEANQLIGKGQLDEAVPVLKKVMQSSRFLSWDVHAGMSLMEIQLEQKNANGALANLKELKRRYGADAATKYPGLEAADWRIRIGLGKHQGLEEELAKAVKGDDRERAARAQMVRGDLYAKKGLLMKAQLDYLRSHLFFKNQDAVQPEALYKIASTFKAKGESSNAKRYFNQLKEQYPDSAYAVRAASE